MKKLSLGWLQWLDADHKKKQKNFVWQCPWRYLVLILLVFFAHFSFHRQLGLYEDDWFFIGDVSNNTWGENLGRIQWAFQTFWQGRPLHMFFLTFFPWLGFQIGGLNGVYGIGFVLVALNTCLIYALARKILPEAYQGLGFLVALLFALYPADTTDPFLTNALGIQPSLFFVLTATYAYLNSRWFLAYILATGSLLTYESLFFLFFAAPYLRTDHLIKHGRRHILILVGILSGYVFLRQLSSEERVANIEMIAALQNLVGRIFYGPIVSFGAFWGRPWEVLSHLSVRDFILGGLLTGIFYLVVKTYIVNPLRQSAPKTDRQEKGHLVRIAWVALGMASILGYCTAIPSHLIVAAINGRASRVHFAAAFGVCLVMAVLWGAMVILARRRRLVVQGIALTLAAQLALLTVFSLQVQADYRRSWQDQQAFWQDVVALAPDLQEGTVLLVYAPNLVTGSQINPLEWSSFQVLSNAVNFPPTWQWDLLPRLYLLGTDRPLTEAIEMLMVQGQRLNLEPGNLGDWQATFNDRGQVVAVNPYSPFRYPYIEDEREVDASQVILLVEEAGTLKRVEQLALAVNTADTMTINFHPPSIPAPPFSYPSNPYFDLLTAKATTAVPRPYFVNP